jgi:hypothetical protein
MEEPDTSARNKLFSDVYLDATKTIRHYDAQRASFASLAVSGLAILFTFVSIQAKEPGNHIFVRVVSIFIRRDRSRRIAPGSTHFATTRQ